MALITVSGHLFDTEGSPLVNAPVVFQLGNFNGNILTVSGTNIVIPKQISMTTDASGHFMGAIQGNDTISPSGTFYQVSFANKSQAIYLFTGAGPINLDSYPPTIIIPALSVPTSGNGTVTSVGLGTPTDLVVTGSPVTTAGTLSLTWATEAANTVHAGPASGSAAAPTWRSLVAADIPTISLTSGVTGLLPVASGGTGTASPAIVAGAGIAVTGSFPDQTVALSGLNIVTVTTTYLAVGLSEFIICNSASAFTVTLPQGSGQTGAKFTVKNINTGTVTIVGASGSIDGAANVTLPTQYESGTFVSDGTNYWII